MAAELWGRIDGRTVTENRVGKGRVFWGKPLKDVLAAIGASPDVEFGRLVETRTGTPVVVDFDSQTGSNPVLVGAERKGWGVEYPAQAGEGHTTSISSAIRSSSRCPRRSASA